MKIFQKRSFDICICAPKYTEKHWKTLGNEDLHELGGSSYTSFGSDFKWIWLQNELFPHPQFTRNMKIGNLASNFKMSSAGLATNLQ